MRLKQMPGFAVLLIVSLVLAGHPAYGQGKKKGKEPKAKKEAIKAETKSEAKGKAAGKKKKGKKKAVEEEGGKKSTKGDAEAILGKAVGLYSEGKYEEAAELFKQANEISPSPNAYYNIARCYDKSYKYKEAHDYYQQYLETGDKVKVDDALEAMKRIEEMLLILKVLSTPDGADVFIDGKPVEGQKTPVIFETKAGKHTVVVKMEGYEEAKKELEIPYGGEGKVEVALEAAAIPKAPPEEKAAKKTGKGKSVELAGGVETGKKKRVPFSLGIAAGATISTTEFVGSFIDASLAVTYRIKGGVVGIGLDNLIFSNSYLLAAYPAGGYRVKVWKHLSLEFVAGFGAAYLNSFDDSGDGKGTVLIEKGSHWDLVAHADIKLCFNAGPILVLLVPVHANVLIGVGSIEPAPLAEFAFLAGIGYDF